MVRLTVVAPPAVALATTAALWGRLINHAAARPLSAFTDEYLSPRHRDDPGKGCAVAALGADVARQGERVRSAFTAGLEPFLQLLSNAVPGRSKAVRRRKAIATMAALVFYLDQVESPRRSLRDQASLCRRRPRCPSQSLARPVR